MTEFLQLSFQGIALGGVYALLALGFTIIYRASNVINFALGGMMLFGVYLASWLTTDLGVPFVISLFVAIVVIAVGGSLFQRGLLSRVPGDDEFVAVMMTLGAGIALVAVVELLFGSAPKSLGDPWGGSSFEVAGVTINWVKLVTLMVTALVVVGFFVLDRRSTVGLAMRATAADEESAAAVGVRTNRVQMVTWALAGGLVVIGGVFIAAFPNQPNLALGDAVFRAFPAIVVGGLGSTTGAALGGVLIGLAEVMTVGYAPDALGDNVALAVPYVLMVLVLLVRPYGMFGSAPAVRA